MALRALLFDQNLAPGLVARLVDLYPNSTHVRFLGLASADDEIVCGRRDRLATRPRGWARHRLQGRRLSPAQFLGGPPAKSHLDPPGELQHRTGRGAVAGTLRPSRRVPRRYRIKFPCARVIDLLHSMTQCRRSDPDLTYFTPPRHGSARALGVHRNLLRLQRVLRGGALRRSRDQGSPRRLRRSARRPSKRAGNASFDRGVRATCCSVARVVPPALRFECTVQLARERWNLHPTRLPDVCRHLGIALNHHNALSDAEACARIVIAAQRKAPKLRLSK